MQGVRISSNSDFKARIAIPPQAELEDFLQKAPLAMHWLSGEI
jgi:hypothetical protein